MSDEFKKMSLQVVLSEYLFSIKKLDTNFIIAKVMLDRLSEFPNISIEKIAYLANTTPSTVTKFCKKLGYDGFSKIKSETSDFNFYGLTSDYVKKETSDAKSFYNFYTQQIKDLYDSLYDIFDHNQISRIAWQLSHCKKISVFTGQHGFCATNFFGEMMRSFDITVYEIDRNSDISILENALIESDMLFIISLTGNWINNSFHKINKHIICDNISKVILLSYDNHLKDKCHELINFSQIPNFFSSVYISNNAIQAFFMLLTSYLSTYSKK